MTDNTYSVDGDNKRNRVWPRRLNGLLLGIGVLAFVLIIANRIIEMRSVDDMPEVAQGGQSDAVQPVVSVPESSADNADSPVAESTQENSGSGQESLSIKGVFGGELVFVSASEPMYVVTDAERRIAVGGSIDDETTLAGVTVERVILQKAGDIFSIPLPELSE